MLPSHIEGKLPEISQANFDTAPVNNMVVDQDLPLRLNRIIKEELGKPGYVTTLSLSSKDTARTGVQASEVKKLVYVSLPLIMEQTKHLLMGVNGETIIVEYNDAKPSNWQNYFQLFVLDGKTSCDFELQSPYAQLKDPVGGILTALKASEFECIKPPQHAGLPAHVEKVQTALEGWINVSRALRDRSTQQTHDGLRFFLTAADSILSNDQGNSD